MDGHPQIFLGFLSLGFLDYIKLSIDPIAYELVKFDYMMTLNKWKIRIDSNSLEVNKILNKGCVCLFETWNVGEDIISLACQVNVRRFFRNKVARAFFQRRPVFSMTYFVVPLPGLEDYFFQVSGLGIEFPLLYIGTFSVFSLLFV